MTATIWSWAGVDFSCNPSFSSTTSPSVTILMRKHSHLLGMQIHQLSFSQRVHCWGIVKLFQNVRITFVPPVYSKPVRHFTTQEPTQVANTEKVAFCLFTQLLQYHITAVTQLQILQVSNCHCHFYYLASILNSLTNFTQYHQVPIFARFIIFTRFAVFTRTTFFTSLYLDKLRTCWNIQWSHVPAFPGFQDQYDIP